eukprot:g12506.t1
MVEVDPSATGVNAFAEDAGKDIQKTRGEGKASKATHWSEPHLDKTCGEPKFYLRSACVSYDNYARELTKVHTHLESLDLDKFAAMLYYRRLTDGEVRYAEMIRGTKVQKIVADISQPTFQTVTRQLEEFAERALEINLAKGSITRVQKEHYLRDQFNFGLRMRLAEAGKATPYLQHVSDHYGIPLGSERSSYCITYDYSDVRKVHAWGGILTWPEDVEEDGVTKTETLKKGLPLVSALVENGAQKKATYEATKLSCIAYLNYMCEVFGSERFLSTVYMNRDHPVRDMDITPWKVPKDVCDGVCRIQGHVLCDQGGPEGRFCQTASAHVPLTFKLPYAHRVSNNVKDIAPKIAASSKAWRSFLNGPKGKKASQGLFRGCQADLHKRAEAESGEVMQLPHAVNVIAASAGNTLAECLKNGAPLSLISP